MAEETGENSQISAGAQFARILHSLGIRRVYGLPGEDHMTLLEAIAAAGLHYYTTYNESSAVVMAGTDAMLTGLPGVALLSMAPGLSNAMNGLLHAYLDELPVLVVSGQHPAGRAPLVVRQGFDLTGLVGPVTKWQARIAASADLPLVVGKAVEEATSGRPGPVYLELPEEVATAPRPANEAGVAAVVDRLASRFRSRSRWSAEDLPSGAGSEPPVPRSGLKAVAFSGTSAILAARLSQARHPVLIVGGHRRRLSRATVERFAEEFRLPVLTSTRQMGLVPRQFPYAAGTFLNGRLEARLLSRSDLVVMVDPEAFDFYNRPWSFDADTVALVDDHFAEWVNQFDACLVADPEVVLGQLAHVGSPAESRWDPAEIESYRKELRAALLEPRSGGISVAQAVDAALAPWPQDGYLVADAGFAKPLVVMLSEPSLPDHVLTSNGLSTMGFAIPAALAAYRAGAVNILAFVGDGSLLMRATELAALAGARASVVIVAMLDRALTQIEVKQRRRGLQPVGVDLPPLSCAKLGAALGVDGVDVDNAEDLEQWVAKGFRDGRPTLVGALVDSKPSRELFELLRG